MNDSLDLRYQMQRRPKEELIKHVKAGDEIGKEIVRAQMSFLKAVASGEFAQKLVSVQNE